MTIIINGASAAGNFIALGAIAAKDAVVSVALTALSFLRDTAAPTVVGWAGTAFVWLQTCAGAAAGLGAIGALSLYAAKGREDWTGTAFRVVAVVALVGAAGAVVLGVTSGFGVGVTAALMI